MRNLGLRYPTYLQHFLVKSQSPTNLLRKYRTYGHEIWVIQDPGYKQPKWAFSIGWQGAPSEIGWGVLSYREKTAEVAWTFKPHSPKCLPREMPWTYPTGRRPSGGPRTCWSDYVSRVALGSFQKSWRTCLGRGKSRCPCTDYYRLLPPWPGSG